MYLYIIQVSMFINILIEIMESIKIWILYMLMIKVCTCYVTDLVSLYRLSYPNRKYSIIFYIGKCLAF